MMKARVYDYNPSWDFPDGNDIYGDYVLRDIDYKSSDNTLVLKNGIRSRSYKIFPCPTIETICEICEPELNPLCTFECQDVCRMKKSGDI